MDDHPPLPRQSPAPHPPLRLVLAGGLVAGTLDILYAWVFWAIKAGVPLSAAGGGGGKDPLWVGLSVAVHMFLIGMPIALFVRAALRE